MAMFCFLQLLMHSVHIVQCVESWMTLSEMPVGQA